MRRKLSVLLATVFAFGAFQLAAPAPASACADPNCPWSPVTAYVYDTLYWVGRNCDWTVGELLDPNPCPF
ncbi:MAG TPA: hypothetical protein VIG64_15355 [Actinomycetota bacterium]